MHMVNHCGVFIFIPRGKELYLHSKTTHMKIYYEMFSPAGEKACQSLVDAVAEKISGKERMTKERIKELYDAGRKKISLKHGEVYDTEPRGNIAHEISKSLRKEGYGFFINSWGDVEEGVYDYD